MKLRAWLCSANSRSVQMIAISINLTEASKTPMHVPSLKEILNVYFTTVYNTKKSLPNTQEAFHIH